jgi:hypothetical protein
MVRRGIIALCLLLLLAPAALADGDPASDVLLGENVFLPYSPPVSSSLQRTLTAQTAAAKRAGLALKVALIGSPVDLGVVPDLFGHPQRYADFLDQEISFTGHAQPLLVVMGAGYGTRGLTAAGAAAARALRPPAGRSSEQLAQAAAIAIPAIARAQGVHIAGAGSSGGGSALPVVLLGAAAALIAAALLVVTLGRRRERAS